MPLERAALDAGIPLDEVEAWAKDRAAVARQPVQGAIGHAAIVAAMNHFQRVLEAPKDYESVSIDAEGNTKAPAVPVHIHAARELARLGVQLAKMEALGRAPKKEKAAGQERDLFDETSDPWAD